MSKKFKLGVIGNPIEHSLSPFIHSRFARQENINLDYQAYKVDEDGFHSFINEFFADSLAKGLNVTLPFKKPAAEIEGSISDEAKQINNKYVTFFKYGPKNDWKKNLSNEVIGNIESEFKTEMKELGYL